MNLHNLDSFFFKWNLTKSPIGQILQSSMHPEKKEILGYDWINPPFSRKLIGYGYGKLSASTSLPSLNKLNQRKNHFFLENTFSLDLKLFENQLDFQGVGRFLLLRRNNQYEVFRTGYFPGPKARFNGHYLSKDEVYISGAHNPEIDSYLKANIEPFRHVEIDELKPGTKPIVFDIFQKTSIENKKFLKRYEQGSVDGSFYIGNQLFKSFSVDVDKISKRLFSKDLSEQYKIPRIILCEFFGGILILDRTKKIEVEKALKLLQEFSPKKIVKFVFNYLPTDDVEILPCLLFVGGNV